MIIITGLFQLGWTELKQKEKSSASEIGLASVCEKNIILCSLFLEAVFLILGKGARMKRAFLAGG